MSMVMNIQNLVKFCIFIIKILSKNQFLTSIKGHNSVASDLVKNLMQPFPHHNDASDKNNIVLTCSCKQA